MTEELGDMKEAVSFCLVSSLENALGKHWDPNDEKKPFRWS